MSTVRAAARRSFSVSNVDASTSDESRLSSFWESSDHDTTSLSGYSSQSDSELLSECSDWNENRSRTESGEEGGNESSDLENGLAVPEAKRTCLASRGGHGGGRWGRGGCGGGRGAGQRDHGGGGGVGRGSRGRSGAG